MGETAVDIELDLFGDMKPALPTKEEAFTGILLLANWSDGEFSDEELDGFGTIINRINLYRDMDSDQFDRVLEKAYATINRAGFDGALQQFAKALPEPLHKAVFANACDQVLADGVVEEGEREFINKLRKALNISPEDAQMIAKVMVIKNKC
jgi:hypothetical protein